MTKWSGLGDSTKLSRMGLSQKGCRGWQQGKTPWHRAVCSVALSSPAVTTAGRLARHGKGMSLATKLLHTITMPFSFPSCAPQRQWRAWWKDAGGATHGGTGDWLMMAPRGNTARAEEMRGRGWRMTNQIQSSQGRNHQVASGSTLSTAWHYNRFPIPMPKPPKQPILSVDDSSSKFCTPTKPYLGEMYHVCRSSHSILANILTAMQMVSTSSCRTHWSTRVCMYEFQQVWGSLRKTLRKASWSSFTFLARFKIKLCQSPSIWSFFMHFSLIGPKK
jgi:hypothetical protein